MVFHMPQKKITIPNLQIADTVIEFVDAFKFLGITISKHLTWNNHVMQVTNKIAWTIGMMHNLKKILPLNILRLLYNSLVLPHLNYGILAWGRQTKQLDIYTIILHFSLWILSVALICGRYRPSSGPIALRHVLNCPP